MGATIRSSRNRLLLLPLMAATPCSQAILAGPLQTSSARMATTGRSTFAMQIPCARCSTRARASTTTAVARALIVGQQRCSSKSPAHEGFDGQVFGGFQLFCAAHVLRLLSVHF